MLSFLLQWHLWTALHSNYLVLQQAFDGPKYLSLLSGFARNSRRQTRIENPHMNFTLWVILEDLLAHSHPHWNLDLQLGLQSFYSNRHPQNHPLNQLFVGHTPSRSRSRYCWPTATRSRSILIVTCTGLFTFCICITRQSVILVKFCLIRVRIGQSLHYLLNCEEPWLSPFSCWSCWFITRSFHREFSQNFHSSHCFNAFTRGQPLAKA